MACQKTCGISCKKGKKRQQKKVFPKKKTSGVNKVGTGKQGRGSAPRGRKSDLRGEVTGVEEQESVGETEEGTKKLEKEWKES